MTQSLRRIRFSNTSLARLQPEKKPVIWYDTKTQGLGVRVSPKGKLTFIFMDGTTRTLKATTLSGARRLANLRRVEKNGDICEWTLGNMFESFIELKAKPRKRTWKRDIARWNLHLKHLEDKQIADIKRVDVMRLHNAIKEKSGPYAANDTVAFLSSLYTFAKDIHEYEGRNPAKKIERFPEQERERYLLPEEFPRWYKTVNEFRNETTRDFILMLLWTGVRREAVISMRWDHVDLKSKVWRISKEDDKGKRNLIVYLSDEALKILTARKVVAKTKWVFPSPNGAKCGHYSDPKSAWKAILKTSGIQDLRIHDLRRTLGSWMAEDGTSLLIIGRALGHKTNRATAIYARLGGSPVRNAVNAAIESMLKTLETNTDGDKNDCPLD